MVRVDEAAAGVGDPAWQRHGPKMIRPYILNASKKWIESCQDEPGKQTCQLTMVPVDDEVSPEDEAAADPAWQRYGPKMIWPYILNASKKWIESCQDEPGKQTCQAHNGPCG